MKNLEHCKQYPIDRDTFCKLFKVVLEKDIDCTYNFQTDSFKYFRIDDEFYLIHLDSGTMVNWYKHLGRCNTCNKNLSMKEYELFAKMFAEEVYEQD